MKGLLLLFLLQAPIENRTDAKQERNCGDTICRIDLGRMLRAGISRSAPRTMPNSDETIDQKLHKSLLHIRLRLQLNWVATPIKKVLNDWLTFDRNWFATGLL